MPLERINPADLATPETYGVTTLPHPGCRIEVEAIALVDDPVFNRSAFLVH